MASKYPYVKWLYDSFGVIMGLAVIAYLVYILLKPAAPDTVLYQPTAQPVVDVNAAVVMTDDLTEYITLNGYTQFLKQSTIRSQSTGYIQGMNQRINGYIKRGSLFCTIRTKEQDALSGIEKLDPSIKGFNKPLQVFSHASGMITALNVHNGDYVAEGEVLAEVKEPSSLVLVVNVPFEYNQQIRPGTNCELLFSDGRKMNRTITGILPTVEATSQTQSYYISMPDQNLPEHLNVTLRMMLRKSLHSSLSVPASALQTDELEQQFWVMRIVNGVAYKVPVIPGVRAGERVEVRQGALSDGDTVVTEGSYKLEDSTQVIIQ
jgi:multidrug efflux pump subunit AcrA (membrane-fusion protein)